MIIAIIFDISVMAFNQMIFILLFLNRRIKDFAYHGINRRNTLITINHIYSQNAVVRNDVSMFTRLNIIYLNDINKHESSISKNHLYLNVVLCLMSRDNKKLAINIIKNHISCCILSVSLKIIYHSKSDMGAIIWESGTIVEVSSFLSA